MDLLQNKAVLVTGGTSSISTDKLPILILLCVSVPSFMISLDSNIVAVTLASIAHALHADFAAIEWVVSAYTLTFASLLLPAGTLADRYGRKNVLLSGLALFTLASWICGAAPSVMILNAARALQGVGAALQLSAALAILSHEFRGPARARAFAFWGSVIGVAMTLGPVTGGFITQTLGWEWAFYINIPVGLVMFGLTVYVVRDSRDPDAKSVDIPGFLSFAAALFLVTLALISGNHRGWSSPWVTAELIAAGRIFGAFLLIELRQPRPMLDLGFFRRPTYIGTMVAMLAYAAALLTMLTYLPLYFQGGLGFAPLKAGLMMLPIALPLFIVPRLVAKLLTHRLSGRTLLGLGLGLVSAGMFLLALVAREFHYLSMLAGMVIAGTGAGILNGETAKVSMTVIPPERAGMAAGMGGTVRFAGMVTGFAALGAILFAQVMSALKIALPAISDAELALIAQSVVAGDLSGAAQIGAGLKDIVIASFGSGYQAIFFTAAAFAAVSAVASWLLIRPADTAPEAAAVRPVKVPVLQAEH
jgi:EmrB/QacA subfamily drug resistance transporter